jgi:autotransporter-associated beta strand protein
MNVLDDWTNWIVIPSRACDSHAHHWVIRCDSNRIAPAADDRKRPLRIGDSIVISEFRRPFRGRPRRARLTLQALEDRTVPSTFSWRVDADGTWNNPNNWTLVSGSLGSGFPNAVGDAASLVTAITANRTITIPTGVTITVGSLLINNSHNFTVAAAGTGTLVLDNTGTSNATLLVANSLGNGSPTISAPLTLADPMQVTNQSTGVLTLSGAIGENAAGRAMLVDGPGTLRLAGNTSNTYTGLTTVSAGTLELNKIGTGGIATAITGNLTVNGGTATEVVNNQLADTAAVAANAGGTFNLNGQSDTFGALTVAGGTVTTNGGRLTAGNTSFNAASTLAMHLAAPTSADRVTVNGTVAVGGTLALTVSSNIAPGTVITLIDNDGADAVTGAFIGLPPGAVVSVGGQPFVITYSGGTGNDVTLIRLAVPPTVTGAVVNGGQSNTTQRSRVTNVTVTFSTQVTFAGAVSSAFALTLDSGGAIGSFTATANDVGGVTVVTLDNFTGSETEFGSLADGRYTLTALASQISAGGLALDGDGNGTAGGNFVFNDANGLFRFFGDINGDRHVDIADFAMFSSTFNLGTGQLGFIAAFDFNADGHIDIADFGQFSIRFFTVLP